MMMLVRKIIVFLLVIILLFNLRLLEQKRNGYTHQSILPWVLI